MIRLIILWLTLIVSVAFLAFPHDKERTIGFPYSQPMDDGSPLRLTYKQYAYDFFEHFGGGGVLIAAYVAISEWKRYRTSGLVYLGIMVADTADFCLTFGDAWTGSPVTFNTLKIITFGASIAYDFIKNGRNYQAATKN